MQCGQTASRRNPGTPCIICAAFVLSRVPLSFRARRCFPRRPRGRRASRGSIGRRTKRNVKLDGPRIPRRRKSVGKRWGRRCPSAHRSRLDQLHTRLTVVYPYPTSGSLYLPLTRRPDDSLRAEHLYAAAREFINPLRWQTWSPARS